MQQQAVHKSLILDFYRRAVGQGDLDYAKKLIADNFIQHSPTVKPGKAGLLEALALMKQLPKPANQSAPFMRLIADGDYVVTNLTIDWGGSQKAIVDLFRFHDGQLIEHWDVVQDKPVQLQHNNAFMDGPQPISDSDATEQNKQKAHAYFQTVVINRRLDRLPHYVAENLKQHTPEIADGQDGLRTFLKQSLSSIRFDTIERVLGEGDFVVVQSSGYFWGQSGICFSVFRFSEGLIVEQWEVKQPQIIN